MKTNRIRGIDMLNALLIIGMQLILVPLTTLRLTFVVKGKKKEASIIAIAEALIYVISLGIVFQDLTNIYNMIAYALGYAGGVYLGGMLEEKLAIGYRAINVSLLDKNDALVELLRGQGFGVTVFEGTGMNDEHRYRLDIIAKRTREKELMVTLKQEAPKAFIVVYEPTNFKGGYLVKNMQKAKQQQKDLS
jgi:uncharacterized protein YebE (UPF0316 family)